MDRGAWWTTVHRVTKSRTQLKQLTMHEDSLPKPARCCFVAQSCPTLCTLMHCSPPGSSVEEYWSGGAISYFRDQTSLSCVSCTGRQILYHQHRLGSLPIGSHLLINDSMLFSLNKKSKADEAAPRCHEGLKLLSLPIFNLPIFSLGLCCRMLPRWLFYPKPSVCGPGRKKKEGKENGQRRKACGRERRACVTRANTFLNSLADFL